MCSSRKKTDKGDVIFTAEFYVEQEKEKQNTETKFQWVIPGAT